MVRHSKLDAANPIGVLECGDDIVCVIRPVTLAVTCRSWWDSEVVHDDWDGG